MAYNVIKPVQKVDPYQLLMQGLGAYREVKGIQQQSAMQEQRQQQLGQQQARQAEQDTRQAELARREDIEWEQRQKQIQQQEQAQQQKQKQEFSESFAKERAETAAIMRGKPVEQKIRILEERVTDLKRRGLDPGATQRLLDMYQKGVSGKERLETAMDRRQSDQAYEDSLQLKAADERIEEAYQTGIIQGHLKPEKVKTTDLPANVQAYQWAYDPKNADNPAAQALRKKLELQGIPSGMRLETDKDGNVTFTTGPGVGEGPSKAVIGALQKDQADNLTVISGLENSLSLMEDDFLTYKGQLKGFALPKIEKAGFALSTEDKQFLDKYTKFRSSSMEDLSKYMNAISGAAINAEEAKRLQKVIANPEDSPTQYVAKVRAITEKLKLRNRIYNDLIREGFARKGAATVAEVDKRLQAGYAPSAAARIADLQKKGLSKQDIFQTLRAEGYK
jgi:hypothetical protein